MPDEQIIDPILLSNFIHQVINPLNGVLGTLDNIIDGTVKEKSRRQQRLETVRAQLSSSIEMIRNLAFLSQLHSSQGIESLRASSSLVNVPTLIIDSIQFFQESGQQHGLKIWLEDKKTQYLVFGHRQLLKQVLLNVIDNCIKYSHPDTTISIETRVQKKTGQLIIEVHNDGVGFENEERNKIFELGYRSQAAMDRKASGSGIGLFICKRIVELVHQGTIEAEHSSRTSKTTIRMRFPKYKIGEPDDYTRYQSHTNY